jgi:hypothetical protein
VEAAGQSAREKIAKKLSLAASVGFAFVEDEHWPRALADDEVAFPIANVGAERSAGKTPPLLPVHGAT